MKRSLSIGIIQVRLAETDKKRKKEIGWGKKRHSINPKLDRLDLTHTKGWRSEVTEREPKK